jgi:hypothetical protein
MEGKTTTRETKQRAVSISTPEARPVISNFKLTITLKFQPNVYGLLGFNPYPYTPLYLYSSPQPKAGVYRVKAFGWGEQGVKA